MEKLHVGIILEILGRPKENLISALEGLINKLGAEPGVKVLRQTIHEPVLAKDSKDLFTSFAEVTLELDSLSNYFGILFAYMPANIELISPERITLPNDELNLLANRLAARLHDYDAITKKAVVERDFLIKKLREAAPHLFKQQPQNAVQKETKEKSKRSKPKKKSKKK